MQLLQLLVLTVQHGHLRLVTLRSRLELLLELLHSLLALLQAVLQMVAAGLQLINPNILAQNNFLQQCYSVGIRRLLSSVGASACAFAGQHRWLRGFTINSVCSSFIVFFLQVF